MKNLLIDAGRQNGNSFALFSNVSLDKKDLKKVKGGEDIIIEEVVEV